MMPFSANHAMCFNSRGDFKSFPSVFSVLQLDVCLFEGITHRTMFHFSAGHINWGIVYSYM